MAGQTRKRKRKPAMSVPHDRLLLSISETCHLLGLGKSTVYELIGSGQLTTKSVGRRRMIHRKDLEAFAKK